MNTIVPKVDFDTVRPLFTRRIDTRANIEFYKPGDIVVKRELRSPEYVQISTAAAITLGLMPGIMYRTACTHCLNILVTYPEGCRANCSYCGLARHRENRVSYADRNFIRVDWPTLRYEDLIDCMKQGRDQGQFQRMCISMITHPNSDQDTFTLLEEWMKEVPQVPVSILSNPTTLGHSDLLRMFDLGAEIFTVALDAVTDDIFERTRGKTVASPHKWRKYWQCIDWASEIFGRDRFGVHLIAGLGETEYELLTISQKIKTLGGTTHLFAFYPEKGSMMEDWPAVPMDVWRRLQVARFIIDYGGGHIDAMQFDQQGRLWHFGLSGEQLNKLIATGKPFQTSGCPGKENDVSACNRPYGDSSPSDIRSYPFNLVNEDVANVCQQMGSRQILRDA